MGSPSKIISTRVTRASTQRCSWDARLPWSHFFSTLSRRGGNACPWTGCERSCKAPSSLATKLGTRLPMGTRGLSWAARILLEKSTEIHEQSQSSKQENVIRMRAERRCLGLRDGMTLRCRTIICSCSPGRRSYSNVMRDIALAN